MRVATILAPLIVVISSPLVAQDSRNANSERTTVSASSRVRYEVLDGQPRAGLPEHDEQIALRTTVAVEHKEGAIRFGAELYDSRAWLHETGDALSANEVNTLELVQAYVGADLNTPFGKGSKIGIQVGRFTLNLGSRRLIAADDYRNTTNGYTGLRADLKLPGGFAANAIYVLPQIRLPDDRPSIDRHRVRWDRESTDLQLWGGYISKTNVFAGATAEFGYFGLFERDWQGHPARDRDLDTFSLRVIRDPKAGHFDFRDRRDSPARLYQREHRTRGGNAGCRCLLHADAGYSFPGKAKLRVSFEYDRASGDKVGGKFGRFDTLFGMRRADLAPAGIYNAIGRANISTVGLRAEIAPHPRWDGFAVYRPMWLAEKTDSFSTTGVRDPSGASGSFAGHQVEGRLRYWLIKDLLRAESNALWLAKGRFLRDAPNAPATGDTRYLATGVTATF